MGNLTAKLRKHAEKILLGMVTTIFLSWLVIGSSTKKYGSGSGIYQGYNTLSDDGRLEYVFDPKTKEERGSRAPEHKIRGDPCLTDSLTRGKRYNFTTIKRGLPWYKECIECILPCKPENSEDK